jgi:hypothetical protein
MYNLLVTSYGHYFRVISNIIYTGPEKAETTQQIEMKGAAKRIKMEQVRAK